MFTILWVFLHMAQVTRKLSHLLELPVMTWGVWGNPITGSGRSWNDFGKHMHTLDRSPGGLTSNLFHATCHVGWKLKIEKIEGYEDRSESWIILDISTCLDPFNLKRDREKRPTGITRISQVLASWPQRPQPSIRGHIPHTLTIQEME